MNVCVYFYICVFAILSEVYIKWAGHLTARSDVYSFGVVLLELLTGRRSVDKTKPSKEQNLVDWARPKLNDKRKLLQIIDPRLENQYSVRAAQKACSLAYYCLSQNPKARPLMSDVVETLEPLQSCNDANEVSASSLAGIAGQFATSAIPDHRRRRRFANNVGPGSSCRSPNPSCSPGAAAACRVRWEMSQICILLFGVRFSPNSILKWQNLLVTWLQCHLCWCTWFHGDLKPLLIIFQLLGACIYVLLVMIVYQWELPYGNCLAILTCSYRPAVGSEKEPLASVLICDTTF